MDHAGSSSSSSGYQPTEQNVSLLADVMVALATSIRAHPRWGPHFLQIQKFDGFHSRQFEEDSGKMDWQVARTLYFDGKNLGEVEGAVRRAFPHLPPACATGVSLALLPMCITGAGPHNDTTWLRVISDSADEEAVAAFYAAMCQPTCEVSWLIIGGDAFGTPAAAASLGRCLNVNSSIRQLTIHVNGFCGEPVWAAFAHTLTSNATLVELTLENGSCGPGNGSHVGATLADSHKLSGLRRLHVGESGNAHQATLEDMEAWGMVLKHKSTIRNFWLHFLLPQGGLVPICEALLTNTTLETLGVYCWRACNANVEVANSNGRDILSLSAMLSTNKSLKHLDIRTSGILCNDVLLVHEGMSQNTTLERLSICMDAAFAQGLMITLAADGDTTINLCPHLRSLEFGWETQLCQGFPSAVALGNMLASNKTLTELVKTLTELVIHDTQVCQGFPSAVALGNMLASNKTLTELVIHCAPYSNTEWATSILPALAGNHTLEMLDLIECAGVHGQLVYDAILELLDINTHIDVNLYTTPLSRDERGDGKTQVVHGMVEVNKEYRAALKNVPTVPATACRLVLCGFPFAGKTTLLQTMIRSHTSHAISASSTTRRTRGIDIQPFTIDGLTMWVWDFAGQREFHPLQDFIFPDATCVYAASAFVFTFNPLQHVIIKEGDSHTNRSRTQKCLQLKTQQQFDKEFSYWLKFICSNSTPRPSRAHKPLVLVVITRKDRLKSMGVMGPEAYGVGVFKDWVRDVAKKFGDKLEIQPRNLFFVDATNKDDPEFGQFVQCALDLLHQRIRDVPQVPAICDFVAKDLGGSGGQQLQPIISLIDFQNLCRHAAEVCTTNDAEQAEALRQLFRCGDMDKTRDVVNEATDTNRGNDMAKAGDMDKASKVIAAYLRDAGELLYIKDLPFLVRNPRWFAHGILGYLVDIISPEDESDADHDVTSKSPELCCSVAANDPIPTNQFTKSNGLITKDFLTELLQRAVDNVGLDPQGTSIDQLILLMEKLDLCYQIDDDRYLIPALFEDEDGKSERGQVKRKWELVIDATCSFVAIRLQCSDSLRTFITPGFFLRLQVVLKNLARKWEIKRGQCICTLEKGFCRLILNDIEILVEYSGYFDYFVDIVVKSCLSQQATRKFVERKIINRIRRLCASPKGCQGLTLVEAIIRPDCIGEDITLCRFRQSIQVATLEQQAVSAPDLKYCWPAVKDERGRTVLPATLYKPRDLLDPDWTSWNQVVFYPDSNVHHGRRRGVAVIVSMVKYNNRGDRSRGGLEDQDKLRTLAGELQFEVKLLQDCKGGELQRQVKEIAAKSICAEDESFLCFVMGHGDSTVDGEHFMWDQDDDMIMLDDIVQPFRTCQHLEGKPKVFFVISCRGDYKPLVHPQPQGHVHPLDKWMLKEGTEVRYLHELKDCLMVFSTAEGAVSARYAEGTHFVGALVTNFNSDKRQTMDVLRILNDVKKEVTAKEHESKDGTIFGQCPVVSDTLINQLYWRSKEV